MTLRHHALFWASAFALFLATIWVFSGVLMPFVLGITIAYLLNPLVVYLGKAGLLRFFSTIIILGAFFILVALALLLAIPPLYQESLQLAERMPSYVDQFWNMITPHIKTLQAQMGYENLGDQVRETLKNNTDKAVKVVIGLLGGLLNGGQAVISFMSVLIFTPFVAFFMMTEWDRITQWVDGLLPRHSYDTIKDLLAQMNKKLSGFIRGQFLVALSLAVIYAVALTIAGLDFGFLIGLCAGLLSIIPLVGSTIGLLVSVFVAWFQSGAWDFVAIIAAIFLIGQFVEGNILTPKLLGGSVGLHPLWILFALMAGGAMFGIVGMLLAVPVAAVIGVLAGFAITQYKNSSYYGSQTKKSPAPKAKKATAKKTTKAKAKKKK